MVGGGSPWSRAGSMSFRLSNLLGPSSFGGTPHASQGDTGFGDNGGVSQPKKQLRFPLKAAVTASVLATTGDTIAQLVARYKRRKVLEEQQRVAEDVAGGLTIGNQGGYGTIAVSGLIAIIVDSVGLFASKNLAATGSVNLWDHDWQRAARMASYGFLIYGPLSQVWYEVLDHFMPVKNLTNLSLKVVANQVILGPIVITLVFAWNKLWEGRLEQLPTLYRTRALQTLLDGWKFWIPASVLNFGVVPLQARVAFMSSCSIFWNFYLSTTMTAGKGKTLPTSKSE